MEGEIFEALTVYRFGISGSYCVSLIVQGGGFFLAFPNQQSPLFRGSGAY